MTRYSIHTIKKSFGELRVLDGLSVDFAESSVTAILGPSGCGKSTLLNIIAGLVESDSGTIAGFEGQRFSYSFQDPRLLPWLSSLENVLFTLDGLKDKNLAFSRATRFMEQAGLEPFSSLKPHQLSGGMRRRLSLARAFAYPADILLLDEAFSAVDLKMRLDLLDLFASLWEEEKTTTILVTHDIQDALYLADRIIVLSGAPATILDTIDMDIPRRFRNLSSVELLEKEARLYRDIVESPSIRT
jgi:NitT/TauT family transport system ATP-binding protein